MRLLPQGKGPQSLSARRRPHRRWRDARPFHWYRLELEKLYELKELARLGPGPQDDKEATVLDRVVRCTPGGLEYEAGPRQAERLVRDLSLSGCKAVGFSGVKPTGDQVQADVELAPQKQRPYRAMVARGNSTLRQTGLRSSTPPREFVDGCQSLQSYPYLH